MYYGVVCTRSGFFLIDQAGWSWGLSVSSVGQMSPCGGDDGRRGANYRHPSSVFWNSDRGWLV